jgi:deoxycytidylate deaminase
MKHKFFELAKQASLKSTHPKYKIGSILVSGNRVLSIGINSLKTHPKSTTPYSFQHSEFDCINSCKNIKQYKNLEIYVYREISNGEIRSSKCCFYCQNMLKYYGIKKIHYTIFNSFETMDL